jgi:acetolactate synthase small subunit
VYAGSLFFVNGVSSKDRHQVMAVADFFRAKIVEVSEESLMVELYRKLAITRRLHWFVREV